MGLQGKGEWHPVFLARLGLTPTRVMGTPFCSLESRVFCGLSLPSHKPHPLLSMGMAMPI